MNALTCAAVRRRLDAFLDDELQMGDRIAVAAHLEWCPVCAALKDESEVIASTLRTSTRLHEAVAADEDGRLRRAIVNRAMAERGRSAMVLITQLFQDGRPVYVGVSALITAVLCVLLTVAIVQLATPENPESLAAMIARLASPGSNDNPLKAGGRVPMPRALGTSFAPPSDDDAVFALSAVVTREGRVEDLRMLRACVAELSEETRLSESLMGAVSQARFEPARLDGEPVAVRMVWVVAHTTVRATPVTGQERSERRRRDRAAGVTRPQTPA
jgi:hypothetical protein